MENKVTCTISLGPYDDLELRTPSGRVISIPVSPHATKMLWQVLWNASAEKRSCGRHSYTTEFPTQAIINAWAKDIMPQRRQEEEEERAAERREALKEKTGIDLEKLDFTL